MPKSAQNDPTWPPKGAPNRQKSSENAHKCTKKSMWANVGEKCAKPGHPRSHKLCFRAGGVTKINYSTCPKKATNRRRKRSPKLSIWAQPMRKKPLGEVFKKRARKSTHTGPKRHQKGHDSFMSVTSFGHLFRLWKPAGPKDANWIDF